jgi:hypothetical protein
LIFDLQSLHQNHFVGAPKYLALPGLPLFRGKAETKRDIPTEAAVETTRK